MDFILFGILIMEKHKVPDIERHQAAFFAYGKGKLLTVGPSFPFDVLGMNDIKSSLPERMSETSVDIFI